jgi:hypothetical protein
MSEKEAKYPMNHDAFPHRDADGFHAPGMTLRDYFAGQAMIGVLIAGVDASVDGEAPADFAARAAYAVADALLRARAK